MIANNVTAAIRNLGTTGGLITRGSVAVTATESATLTSRARAAAMSGSVSAFSVSVSGGGAGTGDTVTSTTSASITNSRVTSAGDVAVSASDTTSIDSQVLGISVAGGLLALAAGGSVAKVEARPTVTATIEGGSVSAANVSVVATALPSVNAAAHGINAGTAAIGASVAEAKVAATVGASTKNVSITAGSLSVLGNLARQAGRDSATATASGSVGGLIGVNSTVTLAENSSTVSGLLDVGTVLAVSGAVAVSATSSTRQTSTASSASIGLVAAGATVSSANSATVTSARVVSLGALNAGSMTVTASGIDDNFAKGISGSGGLVSGTAASASTSMGGSTRAELGSGVTIDLTKSGDSTGLFYLSADHVGTMNGQIITDSYGALAGAGAVVNNTITHAVTATFGVNSRVTARDILATATNTVNKPQLGQANIVGSTGGLASGAAAHSTTVLDITTRVDVGSNADLITVARAGTAGGIRLAANNSINVYDKVSLTTGGALSGAGAYSSIETRNFIAQVNIGANATLFTLGNLTLSANGGGNAYAVSNSETYGAATVASGSTTVIIRPNNAVNIGAGADITAYGDADLLVGTNKKAYDDAYDTSATTDNFAGSAIPITSLAAKIRVEEINTIKIDGGATIKTAGNANLFTNRQGNSNAVARMKGTNWTTAVAGAIDSLLGGSAVTPVGDTQTGSIGTVIVDGTVVTGITRNISIVIDDMTRAPGNGAATLITGTVKLNGQKYDAAGNPIADSDNTKSFTITLADGGTSASATLPKLPITISLGFANAQSNLIKAYEEATKGLSTYKDNATLQAYYQGEVNRIKAELLADGLAEFQTTFDGRTVLIPLYKQVQAITVSPFSAGAGGIIVRADALLGSGKLDAASDTKVEITNNSVASLVITGITMPESNGGTFFNDAQIPVTSSDDFNTRRQTIIAKNAASPDAAAAKAIAGGRDVNFQVLTAGGVVTKDSKSDISLKNTSGARNGNTAPSILIVGDIYAPTAVLNVATAAGGDLTITAKTTIKELKTDVGGTVAIGLTEDLRTYSVGGDPYGQIKAVLEAGSGPMTGKSASDIARALSGSQSSVIASGAVTIKAQYLNLNGLVQSGRDLYRIVIDQSVENEIQEILRNPYRTANLSTLTRDGYSASYNRQTGAIEIDEVVSTGGQINLTGVMLNTNAGVGELRALGGYAKVEVVNQLNRDVVLNRIDLSRRGIGTIDIKDLAYKTDVNGNGIADANDIAFRQTLIRQDAEGVVTRYSADLNSTGAEITKYNGSSTTQYDPKTGYRYAFTIGQGAKNTYSLTTGTSSWAGIDAFAKDPPPLSAFNKEITEKAALQPESAYYYIDASKSGYAFLGAPEYTRSAEKPKEVASWTTSTWYGKKTYYSKFQTVDYTETQATHSLQADYGIKIKFTGERTGTVSIDSQGSGRVLIAGGIKNDNGTTTITSGGTIQHLSSTAAITGSRVTLQAARGIGVGNGSNATDQALNVTTIGAGNTLKATTTAGNINLNVRTVDNELGIDKIAAGGGFDVKLVSTSGITVAG